MEQLAVHAFVELFAALDGQRVSDRLARQVTHDIRGDVQPEDGWERTWKLAP